MVSTKYVRDVTKRPSGAVGYIVRKVTNVGQTYMPKLNG